MPTSDPTLDTLLAFALDAAWQAGRLTLAHFQTGIKPERKADNSPVTLADRQSEQKLRELIGTYWPDHGIIGEEFGQSQGKSRYTWILDPIDGTKSFVSGVPLYAVLVALVEDENPVLGVVHFPGLNETIYARRGGGCYWNGRSAHVSDVSTMSDAVLVASDIDSFAQYGRQAAWQRLIDSTYIQRDLGRRLWLRTCRHRPGGDHGGSYHGSVGLRPDADHPGRGRRCIHRLGRQTQHLWRQFGGYESGPPRPGDGSDPRR